MNKGTWIPGTPAGTINPDRLYAVLSQPTAGYSVGTVIRGDDCNWKATNIIAHFPLPFRMNEAEARRLQRLGWYDLPTGQDATTAKPITLHNGMKITSVDDVTEWLHSRGLRENDAEQIIEYMLELLETEPQVSPDGEVWLTGAEVAARLEAEAKIISNYREQVDRLVTERNSLQQDYKHAADVLRQSEQANDRLTGKLTGYRALVTQIGDTIKQTPEINYSNYGDADVRMVEQTLSDIDMLIGTFGDKPEEIAPQCKECGYEAENQRLQQEVANLETRAQAAEVRCMDQETDIANLTKLVDEADTARQVKDLAMMVKLLCRKDPESEQAKKYMDYLRRERLLGSPLREAEAPKQEPTCGCRFSDAWRCAKEQNLPTLSCSCKCHRSHPIKAEKEATDGR